MPELNFPSSPVDGQTYTSGTTTWTYRASYGVWDITSSGPAGYTGSKGVSYIGDTPPSSPIPGDTWYDSSEGLRYVYYSDGTSSQWVQETTTGPIGYTGSASTAQGPLGYTGSRGFTGSQGDTGFVGSTGFTGSFGTTGFTGSQGFTGSRGPTTIPQSGSDKTTSYTLQISDVGNYVGVGSGGSITIPDATFSNGDVVSLYNNTSANVTITCTITTAYISGTNTDKATVTLATRGVCTILFVSGTVCVISGAVS